MDNLKGLAHIALYTKDAEKTIEFYTLLGGQCYAKDTLKKPMGTNLLAMIHLAGFDLEIIQPGDGTDVLKNEGLWPHIALEVQDLPTLITKLKVLGITTFKTDQPVELPELFGGLRNIFLYGPNGELIELIEHLS